MTELTIAQMRESLQSPRKSHDTLYGKWVMRRFSIYLTALSAKAGFAPSTVTTFSVIAGLCGAALLANQRWLAGILAVNLWYLLDHVDGELARLQKSRSLTGLYYDTFTNSVVPPLTFVGLGIGLSGAERAFAFGLLSAHGFLMLLIISYCEAAVVMQQIGQGILKNSASSVKSEKRPSGAAKKLFSLLHSAVAFPVFLPVLTLGLLAGSAFGEDALQTIAAYLLMAYGVTVTVVWVSIAAHLISTAKLDKKYAP